MNIRARVRRRLLGVAKWVSRSAKLMAVGGALVFGGLIVAFPHQVPERILDLATVAFFSLLLSPAMGLLGMALRVGGLRRKGTLRREGKTLELLRDNGQVQELGTDLRSGVVLPKGEDFEVLLRLADGNELSILVDDEATAEQVLELSGVSHEKRSTRVRWATPWSRIAWGSVGFITTLVAGLALMLSSPRDAAALTLLLGSVMPFIAAGALSQLLAWREVEVGTDAITWRFHGKRTVLAMREVASVDVRENTLIINLRDGSQRRFDINRRGFTEGLKHRIESVLAELGQSRGKQSLFALSGSFAEWKDRMRSLLDRGGSFRDLPVDVTDTMRVLEDPNAEPEMRVGAALALGRLEEQEIADKVRVVADTCVSPKLRIALAAAAGGDVGEEVVEAAREELRGKQQKRA